MGYLSIYDEIESIWMQGESALRRGRVSSELEIAIGELKDALQQSHDPRTMGQNIVDVWEYNMDDLYEQERENYAYHLIDPMLDALERAGY